MRRRSENFYSQQIFGDDYLGYLPQGAPASSFLSNQTLSLIDPVVHHRTPSTPRQEPVRSPQSSYIESRTPQVYHHSIQSSPSTSRRPLPPKPLSSYALNIPTSPLPSERSVGSLTSCQRIFPRQTFENRSARASGTPLTKLSSMGFHSFDEGLDYRQKYSTPRKYIGSFDRNTFFTKSNHYTSGTESNHSHEMSPCVYTRKSDFVSNYVKTTFSPSNQRLRPRINDDVQYKTVLYVTSTPRSSLPNLSETNSHRECGHNHHHRHEHQHSQHQSYEKVDQSNTTNNYVCSKRGKRGSKKHRKEWPREHANYSQSDESLRHAMSNIASVEQIRSKNVESSSTADQPRIIFQGPGRYLEEKPYYGTVPSPQQMHVTIQDGTELVAPEPSPLARSSPLKVVHHDYNQVIVDIKPRQVQEADRQQHISHWIHSSSIDAFSGNRLANKADIAEVSTEYFHTERPSLRINQEDHSTAATENMFNLLRPQNEPFQLTVNPEVIARPNLLASSRTGAEALGPSSDSSNAHTLRQSTVTTTNIQTEPPAPTRLYIGKLVDPVPLFRASVSCVELDIRGLTHTWPTKSADKPVKFEERIHIYKPEDDYPSIPKSSVQMLASPELIRPLPMIPTRILGSVKNELKQDTSQFKSSPKQVEPLQNQTIIYANNVHKLTGAAPQTRDTLAKADVLSSEEMHHLSNRQTNTMVSSVRGLAAFFSEIIRRQSEPWSSQGLDDVKRTILYGKVDLEMHRVPACVSPFLLLQETPKERKKRLQAVNSLRRRGSLDIIPDFTKPSMLKSGAIYRDYNPYTRPASAPRYHT